MVETEAQAPFDLAEGPLLRTRVIRVQPDDHVILLNMHHIVSDGWSMGVLVRELAALYTAFADGRSVADCGRLPIQYADYGFWQRSWLEGRDPPSYWRPARRRQLRSQVHPCSNNSTTGERSSTTSRRCWNCRQTGRDLPSRPTAVQRNRSACPLMLARQIAALGHDEGATPFMTLLAAFQALLHRYSGQDDIAVGTPIANRTHGETEGLIGFFVNTLVMRGRCGGNPTFRELLAAVKETALGAYAHQDLPFETLVDALQPHA